ncbi:hypothetical protein V8C35DRAFT_308952 [Trichoderma chlorosporum]
MYQVPPSAPCKRLPCHIAYPFRALLIATRLPRLDVDQLLNARLSLPPTADTKSCISTTTSNCRHGPIPGSDGASAATYLCDQISLDGAPQGNTCVAVISHPGCWLRRAGLGMVAPPFQSLARTTPSIHAAEYVLLWFFSSSFFDLIFDDVNGRLAKPRQYPPAQADRTGF